MQLTGFVRGVAEVNHIENMKYGVLHFAGVRVPPDIDMSKLANWCLDDGCLGHVSTKTISC